MKIISEICDKIECELKQAEKYIDCAIYVQQDYPQLAETYYKLSDQRMKDQSMLHDQVVAIINEYKKSNGEPPETMKFLYEYLHKKFIDWATQIKIKQNLYKTNT